MCLLSPHGPRALLGGRQGVGRANAAPHLACAPRERKARVALPALAALGDHVHGVRRLVRALGAPARMLRPRHAKGRERGALALAAAPAQRLHRARGPALRAPARRLPRLALHGKGGQAPLALALAVPAVLREHRRRGVRLGGAVLREAQCQSGKLASRGRGRGRLSDIVPYHGLIDILYIYLYHFLLIIVSPTMRPLPPPPPPPRRRLGHLQLGLPADCIFHVSSLHP